MPPEDSSIIQGLFNTGVCLGLFYLLLLLVDYLFSLIA